MEVLEERGPVRGCPARFASGTLFFFSFLSYEGPSPAFFISCVFLCAKLRRVLFAATADRSSLTDRPLVPLRSILFFSASRIPHPHLFYCPIHLSIESIRPSNHRPQPHRRSLAPMHPCHSVPLPLFPRPPLRAIDKRRTFVSTILLVFCMD